MEEYKPGKPWNIWVEVTNCDFGRKMMALQQLAELPFLLHWYFSRSENGFAIIFHHHHPSPPSFLTAVEAFFATEFESGQYSVSTGA